LADVLHDDLIPAIKEIMDSGFFTRENFELLLVPLKMLAWFGGFLTDHPTTAKLYFGVVIAGLLGVTKIATGVAKIFHGLWKVVKPFTRFADDAVKAAAGVGQKITPFMAGGDDVLRVAGSTGAKGGMMSLAGKGLTRFLGPIGAGLLAIDVLEWMTGYDVPYLAQGGYVTGMANGGPVAGGPYLVGEHGPELFMPGQSGQVLNTADTNNIMGSDIIMRNVTIGIDSFGGLV